MEAPIPALVAVAWAVVGPFWLVAAATRIRRGSVRWHVALMSIAVTIELGILVGFGFVGEGNPRRAALESLPIFKVHLAFAVTTLAGVAWQVTSRIVPRFRRWHRLSGPYVVLVWSLALVTGIYNFVFLYLMGRA